MSRCQSTDLFVPHAPLHKRHNIERNLPHRCRNQEMQLLLSLRNAKDCLRTRCDPQRVVRVDAESSTNFFLTAVFFVLSYIGRLCAGPVSRFFPTQLSHAVSCVKAKRMFVGWGHFGLAGKLPHHAHVSRTCCSFRR